MARVHDDSDNRFPKTNDPLSLDASYFLNVSPAREIQWISQQCGHPNSPLIFLREGSETIIVTSYLMDIISGPQIDDLGPVWMIAPSGMRRKINAAERNHIKVRAVFFCTIKEWVSKYFNILFYYFFFFFEKKIQISCNPIV